MSMLFFLVHVTLYCSRIIVKIFGRNNTGQRFENKLKPTQGPHNEMCTWPTAESAKFTFTTSETVTLDLDTEKRFRFVEVSFAMRTPNIYIFIL